MEGHRTLFSHPTPSEAAEPPGLGLNSRQQSTSKSLFSFFKGLPNSLGQGQGGQKGQGAGPGRGQKPKLSFEHPPGLKPPALSTPRQGVRVLRPGGPGGTPPKRPATFWDTHSNALEPKLIRWHVAMRAVGNNASNSQASFKYTRCPKP